MSLEVKPMSHLLRNIVVAVVVLAAIYFVFFQSGGDFDEGVSREGKGRRSFDD
ncbi:hypothetical protein IIC68_02090 [archaeon]|nr:hypothetical protein [archaeon]